MIAEKFIAFAYKMNRASYSINMYLIKERIQDQKGIDLNFDKCKESVYKTD